MGSRSNCAAGTQGDDMSNGLATNPRAYNPFIGEIYAKQVANQVITFARFLDSRRMQCLGGCGLIHESNLQAHTDYGCEGATTIGRGPIAVS